MGTFLVEKLKKCYYFLFDLVFKFNFLCSYKLNIFHQGHHRVHFSDRLLDFKTIVDAPSIVTLPVQEMEKKLLRMAHLDIGTHYSW